jgi:glutathione S-transferase
VIILYDLLGDEDRRFSPYCWRIRLALAHKGLKSEDIRVGLTDKDKVAFSGQSLVPVIVDKANGDKVVNDSWNIACYLEQTYPQKPLFGGAMGQGATRLINNWAGPGFLVSIGPMVIRDLMDRFRPVDHPYFRESREKRYGKTLEQVQEGREARLPGFRAALEPIRQTVAQQKFICGEQPGYADYIVFSGFQWARMASDFQLIAADDPIAAWIGRIDGLYDGLTRKVGWPKN